MAYAWPVLDPNLDPSLETFFFYASWTVWLAFTVDFLIRLWLSERRRSYALHHWYDVVLIAAPVLRPLRLLRLLAFARIINRSAVGGLTGRVAVYVAGAALFAISLGSLAVLDAERDAPGANITTPGDALWWASTTVTTVGYGDQFPVTTQGRFVAVALMVVGIAIVGSLTAVIASWMIQNVQHPEQDDASVN